MSEKNPFSGKTMIRPAFPSRITKLKDHIAPMRAFTFARAFTEDAFMHRNVKGRFSTLSYIPVFTP